MADDFKARIDALLAELRSWGPLERKATVEELADRYGLDVFVVQRLASSEGIQLKYADIVLDPMVEVDPAADTKPIERDDIPEDEDDPEFEDKDTGVWKQNRETGEWALIDDDEETVVDPED